MLMLLPGKQQFVNLASGKQKLAEVVNAAQICNLQYLAKFSEGRHAWYHNQVTIAIV